MLDMNQKHRLWLGSEVSSLCLWCINLGSVDHAGTKTFAKKPKRGGGGRATIKSHFIASKFIGFFVYLKPSTPVVVDRHLQEVTYRVGKERPCR